MVVVVVEFADVVPLLDSVRFAPPLVIEEEDLKKAIRIIGETLNDLDTVRSSCPLFIKTHH